MKTKFILSAMCLPLAFAACTNEEVFVENQNALENAPVVEFKVAATYGADGAESRMVNNNGTFLWEGTDVLGAALNFDGSNNHYSNNKFVNTLTEPSATVDFTTQSTTIVGQYLFYYPYNTDMTSDLNGVKYSFPTVQNYDPTGEEMMNNNFMISPNVKVDGNEPGELTLPITLRSIYGYGVLNLKLADNASTNSGTTNVNSVNIQKIIISYSSLIEEDGIINVDALPVADLSTNHLEALSEGAEGFDQDALLTVDEEKALVGKTAAEIRKAILDKADKIITARVDDNVIWKSVTTAATESKISNVAISCISEENPNGIALAKGGQFSTRVLLPTVDNATVTVKVYTDKGATEVSTYSLDVLPGHKTVLGYSAVNEVLTMSSFNSDKTIDVISEDDFIASMAQFQNIGEDEINVSVSGDFALTEAAIAAIPEDILINFSSDVNFEGNMTLKNMTFSKKVRLNEGKIELSEGIVAKNYIIVRGAEVTTTGSDLNVKDAGIFVYDGSLTIDMENEDGEEVEMIAKNIEVVSLEDGEAPVLTINSPVKVVDEQGDDSMKALYVKPGAVVMNNSTVSCMAVMVDAVATNAGVIEYLFNDGVLNNSGAIKTGKNNCVVNQLENGVILKIENWGLINTVANSEVTAENYGNIIYVVGARVAAENKTGKFQIGGSEQVERTGAVTYEAPSTFAAADFTKLNDAVTKVLFNSDFTMATGDSGYKMVGNNYVTVLEFKGDLTVTGKGGWTLNDNSKLIFTGATSTVDGGTISNVAAIEVGVAENNNTETIEEVATNVTIVKGTTIEGVKTVKFNSNKAQVWNEGNVYHAGTTPEIAGGYWKANQIEGKPAASGN